MSDQPSEAQMNWNEIKPGQEVCVYGQGTAFGMHKHTTVERLTATQIVLADTSFRLLRKDGSVYGSNGGGYAWYMTGLTCQKKKEASK